MNRFTRSCASCAIDFPKAPVSGQTHCLRFGNCRRCEGRQLILDAGCGVGLSTRWLATLYPNHFVIGVDQYADRLQHNVHWLGTTPKKFCRPTPTLPIFGD